ncbi:MAG: hypothetical protein WBH03_05880 [Cyclobacteriaceae bacterium]
MPVSQANHPHNTPNCFVSASSSLRNYFGDPVPILYVAYTWRIV